MNTPVKFASPPVVELVFSVSFDPHGVMKSAHVGEFWSLIRDEFPEFEDAPPVGAQDGADDGQSLLVQFDAVPPLRRTLFVSRDGRRIVQVQQDRFLFNWKRTLEDDTYPGYVEIVKEFEILFQKFEGYLGTISTSPRPYFGFELTYVNQIDKTNGLQDFSIGELFVDHKMYTDAARYLPVPAGVSWASLHIMPNEMGQLKISSQSGHSKSTGDMTVRLDLAASGMHNDRRKWFEEAHLWITKGFADITCPSLHKLWGRES